jgi:ribosomal protein L18E
LKARRTHGRAIARVAMTSAKAFACAMCGAPATMTCGGCAGFAYCAEACLRSHWASGHAEACARVARDVAATAAVRAAHDVDALAWWRVAVVHVDEGLATACDALGACHGVGAFRRECACFRGVPFGTLPRDADDADDADADETFEGADVCMHRAPRSRSRTHSTVVTGVESLSIPANTWLDVYARLGAPRTSRAAIAFSAAATTARFAEKVLLRAANEREGFSRRDGRSNARTNETHDDGDESSSASSSSSSGSNAFSNAFKPRRPRRLPFVIHLLGAEKELDQASAFARFLSRVWRGDSFRALVARDVEVHMVGPEVPEGWRPVVSLDGDENGERDDAPRVSVFGHKGLYHDAVREAETRRARENDVRAKTTLATAPDLVVCPDAGIAAFASWVPTIDLVLRLGAPALVTDLTAEAARMAADIWRRRAARMFPTRKNNASAGSSADVALNPFRRVMSARGNDTQAPTYGNGFGFEWVPGEGVEPL